MGWLKFRTPRGTEVEMTSGPAIAFMAYAAAATACAAVALVKVANAVETVAEGAVELAHDPESKRAIAEGITTGIAKGTSLVRNAPRLIGR
jgi:hypothetical protein